MDKYEEALQKAKRLYDGLDGYSFNRKVLEEIFPELRESEDERVRKELINYHTLLAEKFKYDDMDRHKVWLAWLEKQKGPKQECGEKGVNGPQEIGYWVGDEGVCKKQKEQKPTDLPPGFYFIDLDGKRYYSKEFRYGDMKMKVVEQKSAEWSEEDERILKGIIGKIDHDQTYGVSKVEMLTFLKSIHPQSKQE